MKRLNNTDLEKIQGASFWGAFCTTVTAGGVAAAIAIATPAITGYALGASVVAGLEGAGYASTVVGGTAALTGLCDF